MRPEGPRKSRPKAQSGVGFSEGAARQRFPLYSAFIQDGISLHYTLLLILDHKTEKFIAINTESVMEHLVMVYYDVFSMFF